MQDFYDTNIASTNNNSIPIHTFLDIFHVYYLYFFIYCKNSPLLSLFFQYKNIYIYSNLYIYIYI